MNNYFSIVASTVQSAFICSFTCFPCVMWAESMRTAVEQLSILGAVDRKDDQVSLTPLGKKMACFPLEPRFSKVRNILLCFCLYYYYHLKGAECRIQKLLVLVTPVAVKRTAASSCHAHVYATIWRNFYPSFCILFKSVLKWHSHEIVLLLCDFFSYYLKVQFVKAIF